MRANRLLAIDPGTRVIGIAVFQDRDLLYYGVKTITGLKAPHKTLQKVAQIIRELIADYEPSILSIEKMFLIQKSASLLIVTAEEIKTTARTAGLKVYEYAPTVVRKTICKTGRATKAETARVIAGRYPELRRYLDRRTKWETLYYANMFDAVAVGVTAYMEISGATLLGDN